VDVEIKPRVAAAGQKAPVTLCLTNSSRYSAYNVCLTVKLPRQIVLLRGRPNIEIEKLESGASHTVDLLIQIEKPGIYTVSCPHFSYISGDGNTQHITDYQLSLEAKTMPVVERPAVGAAPKGVSAPKAPLARAYVFISYAHADQVLVERVVANLERHGIRCWMDKEGIRLGARDWDTVVRAAIKGSRAVVLMASPSARASGYVCGELTVADTYKQHIFPVWVSGEHWIDCVPLNFGGTQRVDARGEGDTREIANLIRILQDLTSPAASERR